MQIQTLATTYFINLGKMTMHVANLQQCTAVQVSYKLQVSVGS